MRVKSTVSIKDVCFQIAFAIGVAEGIYRRSGSLCVTTSINDGKHSSKSLHYVGRAVDLRTKHLYYGQKQAVYQDLKATLEPRGFDVVLEVDHIHIEWQPKGEESLFVVVP